MSVADLKQRIHSTLKQLKSEQVRTETNYKHMWDSGMNYFNLVQDLERIRNKCVELETALKIIEEMTKSNARTNERKNRKKN